MCKNGSKSFKIFLQNHFGTYKCFSQVSASQLCWIYFYPYYIYLYISLHLSLCVLNELFKMKQLICPNHHQMIQASDESYHQKWSIKLMLDQEFLKLLAALLRQALVSRLNIDTAICVRRRFLITARASGRLSFRRPLICLLAKFSLAWRLVSSNVTYRFITDIS